MWSPAKMAFFPIRIGIQLDTLKLWAASSKITQSKKTRSNSFLSVELETT